MTALSLPAPHNCLTGQRKGKYFPLAASADVPSGTIFPAVNGGADFISGCYEKYNITTPSPEELQTKYRYTPEDLRDSTRIIWSLAQYDTTSGVSPNAPGINAPALSADRNISRILYTSNMAHREDLFAPDPSDRDTVVRVSEDFSLSSFVWTETNKITM